MNATDTAVAEYLSANGFLFTASFVRIAEDADKWKHYLWRVTLTRPGAPQFATDYRCGMGHVIVKNPRSDIFIRKIPAAPTAACVVHSLLLDGEAIDQSFADWCENYGADADSIKQRALYDTCCDIGREMRRLFTPEQRAQLREMLADY